jgi:hypothetical protein
MAAVDAVTIPIVVAVVLVAPISSAGPAVMLGLVTGLIGTAAGLRLAGPWIWEHG